MLTECIEVFAKILEQKGMGIILDNYVPANGIYIIVDKEGNVESCTSITKGKDGKLEDNLLYEVFQKICFYDYTSKLITMNKPIGNKGIHSNNYLSFAIKRSTLNNNKLNEIIDNYFDILKDPLKLKYKKSKGAIIYQEFVKQCGEVNKEFLEKNRDWIKQNIFHLDTLLNIDLKKMDKDDYIKIFFTATKKDFVRESNRYTSPNIYNKNEYNREINGKIYGLPNDNISMNKEKPYLALQTRKVNMPYLIEHKKAFLRKLFFDYLMNVVSRKEYNVYVDTQKNIIETLNDKEQDLPEIKSGYYLRIRKEQKGPEVAILQQDNITNYHNGLDKFFEFKNILNIDCVFDKKDIINYGMIETRAGIGVLINQVFFLNRLQNNYFTASRDIKNIYEQKLLKKMILLYRNTIFDWVYKGIDNNFCKSIDKFSLALITENILNDHRDKVIYQLNLWWSLNKYLGDKEKENMGEIVTALRTSLKEKILGDATDIKFTNDREYFYGVGQLAYYLISRSKAKDKTHALLNPIINVKNAQTLKDRIISLYKKYNYDIKEVKIKNNRPRFDKLLVMILGYTPDNHKIQEDMIILGFVDNNIIYTNEDKETVNNQEE